MADGLHHMFGKKKLYLSMLRKFAVGQKNAAAEILNALEENNRDTAQRIAHTLKGLAGNIGANSLQQLAGKIESEIKEHQSRKEIDDGLNELKKMLENLVGQLEQKLPEEPGRRRITFNRQILNVVCDKLEALLVADRAEAAEVLDENADMLNEAFPNHYGKLVESIQKYDFDKALTELRSARISSNLGNHC
jgi:two-component system sensor histidine kinase/response regulator